MKQFIRGIKNSQKIRVIIDGVGVYMTVRDACIGFATHSHAVAVNDSLTALSLYNYNNPVPATGHVGTWNGHTVQIDIIRDTA
jgi:hypothetical protein